MYFLGWEVLFYVGIVIGFILKVRNLRFKIVFDFISLWVVGLSLNFSLWFGGYGYFFEVFKVKFLGYIF